MLRSMAKGFDHWCRAILAILSLSGRSLIVSLDRAGRRAVSIAVQCCRKAFVGPCFFTIKEIHQLTLDESGEAS